MEKYNPQKIESKWQKEWEENKAINYGKDFSSEKKHYHLVEFPYPSGAGLHVGHCMGYGASDSYCRMKRMQGYNVMFPIGWDAFGLPTENFAIKTGKKPRKVTEENTDTFRKQMKSLGLSFDWDRELNTTDPNYYKWTQWIFLQFYKHGIINGKLVEVANDDFTTPRLAYQAEIPINWCPSCKIGLANEEVVSGKCERCGAEVVKKMQKQWMLRITAYADRLIKDLDTVDYLEKIKTQQINWIGRSEGTNIIFKVKDLDTKIEVFTTRPDTLFGCTYIVLAPESRYTRHLLDKAQNSAEVLEYIEKAKKKSDMERTELAKEKTGVKLKGITAINPINDKEVEVWVADYVLANYGTGAVMAVPAHDERDWEFARKYNIAIKEVVIPAYGEEHEHEEERYTVQAFVKNREGNFLALKWQQFGWISFPLGGIDKGESPEDAVVREVLEETGYKIKPIERLGGPVLSHFYAENKKVWRKRIDQAILCELTDEQPVKVSEEESQRHQPLWMSSKELLKKITHKDNLIGLHRFLNNNYSFTDYGYLINSGEFDGMSSKDAKKKITQKLKKHNAGDFTINYKLRDWVFSRQHYWGEPIPIIHCEKCGVVPMDEKDLPLTLPDVENYQPTSTGESPLAAITDWVNTKCPKCGGEAKRETDTMPNWAGSSWYFLRYCDPRNYEEFASSKKLDYWMPVDLYNGGMEHTTLHLLYSRFWHKFLYDLGKVSKPEPYQKRIAHGIILGADGRKMSKSFGNVINPDEIIAKFGADATRAYIMFIGPYDQESAWNMAGVQGVYRFLNRVYNNFSKLSESHKDSKDLLVKLNQSVIGVENDIENFQCNTVVSKLMELNNAIEKEGEVSPKSYKTFLKLLFPVAPHLASELWEKSGENNLIDTEGWPEANKDYLIKDKIEIVVQINGKVRDRINVMADISDEELKKIALNSERVKQNIKDKKVVKTIIVPKKLVSLVVK